MVKIRLFLNQRLLQELKLTGNRITIGRSADNDVVLNDPMVSRLHAVIEQHKGGYVLTDHSTNGTSLDDTPVTDSRALGAESVIEIHPFRLLCTPHSDDVTSPLIIAELETTGPHASGPPASGIQRIHFVRIVGEAPSMHRVYETIGRLANSSASVLIRGESGTGKELVAQSIHSTGPRGDAPFVAVDCAALPEALIESELFGYEKGAFTGAVSMKKGWFEQADGGTLFLDEIGELSASAQSKLLRFLQDKSFARLGGTKKLKAEARLIAATNKDLEEAVHRNQFRSDLYFRLRVVQIQLPPLRERKGDIPLLTDHILAGFRADHNLNRPPLLTASAAAKLRAYYWPGNVRQLENVLYHAFIATPPPHIIEESHLDLGFDPEAPAASFKEINRRFLLETLKSCDGDTAKAAEVLKVSRGTIYYQTKKLGIKIRELAK